MLAQGRTYRWVDENGGTVFSQTPPPPGVEATVVGKPPPPAESPEVAQQRLQEQLQKLEDAREDRALAKDESAKATADKQRRKEGCNAARNNIELYDGTPPNRLIDDGSGNYRRVSQEERAAKIELARKYLDENCK